MKDGSLFAVPANEQVWAKVTTRLDTAGEDKQARPYEQWFSLKAIPDGWACVTDSNADELCPELASMPSLPLADTALYGDHAAVHHAPLERKAPAIPANVHSHP